MRRLVSAGHKGDADDDGDDDDYDDVMILVISTTIIQHNQHQHHRVNYLFFSCPALPPPSVGVVKQVETANLKATGDVRRVTCDV